MHRFVITNAFVFSQLLENEDALFDSRQQLNALVQVLFRAIQALDITCNGCYCGLAVFG